MGLFSDAPICSVCGEECDFPKYKLEDGNWLCQDCLKDAGLGIASPYNKMSVREIKELISKHASAQNAAKNMYDYAVANGFGQGFNAKWGIKHFSIIQEHLLPNERVLMTFIGLHNYESTSNHDKNFAYAITNKRFIMAQKQTISGEIFQTVSLENVNDITFKSGLLSATVTIDTIKEVFNVNMSKESAKKVYSKILEILNSLKKKEMPAEPAANTGTHQPSSAADEILKFKKLLDQGIITQAEFDEQTKKLLNL